MLEPAEPRVGEVERNREAGDVIGRKPVVGQPDVRLEPEQSLVELVIDLVDAALQPREKRVLKLGPERLGNQGVRKVTPVTLPGLGSANG